MKIAISLDDSLLREADDAARRLGVSRSRLFALAAADFLRRERHEEMLLRLNRVYSRQPEAADRAVVKGIKAKLRRTKDGW